MPTSGEQLKNTSQSLCADSEEGAERIQRRGVGVVRDDSDSIIRKRPWRSPAKDRSDGESAHRFADMVAACSQTIAAASGWSRERPTRHQRRRIAATPATRSTPRSIGPVIAVRLAGIGHPPHRVRKAATNRHFQRVRIMSRARGPPDSESRMCFAKVASTLMGSSGMNGLERELAQLQRHRDVTKRCAKKEEQGGKPCSEIVSTLFPDCFEFD